MSVAEMRMLRWIRDNMRDKMSNENIRTKIDVAFIEERIWEKIAYDGSVMCDIDLQMRQSGE